jgi:hypothetical protein
MATFLYKWLFISVVSISGFFGESGQKIKNLHPLHVSTTEINHNATDKTLEISCRVFPDDFESALVKQFKTKADLSSSSMKKEMDTLVKKYICSQLQLKTDGKAVSLTYVGFENDKEAVYVYMQADNVSTVKKIEAVNTLFHNIFDDQVNIMHVIVGGNRKSNKLDYPNTQAIFIF